MAKKKQKVSPMYKSIDEAFAPLGGLTSPTEELLSGKLGYKILDEVLGRPGKSKRKRND
jgi:hypothetical protein